MQAIVGLARRVLSAPVPAAGRGSTAPGRPGGAFAKLLSRRPLDEHRGRLDDEGPDPPQVPVGQPATAAPPGPPLSLTPQERAATALRELWPALVRSVAWEGDGTRACMRLELGGGALSGATLLLRCEGGRVHVALSHPLGADLDPWRARIGARLIAAGLVVDGVE
jgi:hypothetical protein